MKTKKELRTQILQTRDALTEEQRHNYSAEITKTVLASEEYQNSETMLIYASFRSEVNTFPLIEQCLTDGKKVYVPKIEEVVQNDEARTKRMEFYEIFSMDELQNGFWGIPEPKAELERRFSMSEGRAHNLSEDKVLILFPGAVFDLGGSRIGYGGGFYDRYIRKLEQEEIPKGRENEESENRIYKIALAFECQLMEQGMIPVEPHDIRVDAIVTERGLRKCKQSHNKKRC